jgi:hypothetical protein
LCGCDLENTGKWEFRFQGQTVLIRQFDARLPSEPAARKDWELRVEEDWGMIRLRGPIPIGLMYLGAKRH